MMNTNYRSNLIGSFQQCYPVQLSRLFPPRHSALAFLLTTRISTLHCAHLTLLMLRIQLHLQLISWLTTPKFIFWVHVTTACVLNRTAGTPKANQLFHWDSGGDAVVVVVNLTLKGTFVVAWLVVINLDLGRGRLLLPGLCRLCNVTFRSIIATG
jgi:hypothetical protein